jgi:Fe-S-cluster containining protein
MTDRELMIDCPRCGHCCPQPEQEWVGLTDDEVQEIMEKTVATCSELDDFTGDTARLTWKNCEAKLREKNGG